MKDAVGLGGGALQRLRLRDHVVRAVDHLLVLVLRVDLPLAEVRRSEVVRVDDLQREAVRGGRVDDAVHLDARAVVRRRLPHAGVSSSW